MLTCGGLEQNHLDTTAKTGDSNLHKNTQIRSVNLQGFCQVESVRFCTISRDKKHTRIMGEKGFQLHQQDPHQNTKQGRKNKSCDTGVLSLLTIFPQQKQIPTTINHLQKKLGPQAVFALPKSILNQKP